MSVIVEKSICFDCTGKDTCQRLKRLCPGKSIKEEFEGIYDKAKREDFDTDKYLYKINGEYRKRSEETFQIIIVNCSMKVQYSERKRMALKEIK